MILVAAASLTVGLHHFKPNHLHWLGVSDLTTCALGSRDLIGMQHQTRNDVISTRGHDYITRHAIGFKNKGDVFKMHSHDPLCVWHNFWSNFAFHKGPCFLVLMRFLVTSLLHRQWQCFDFLVWTDTNLRSAFTYLLQPL